MTTSNKEHTYRFETLLLNRNGVSVYSHPNNSESKVITDFFVAYCEDTDDHVFQITPKSSKSVYLALAEHSVYAVRTKDFEAQLDPTHVVLNQIPSSKFHGRMMICVEFAPGGYGFWGIDTTVTPADITYAYSSCKDPVSQQMFARTMIDFFARDKNMSKVHKLFAKIRELEALPEPNEEK